MNHEPSTFLLIEELRGEVAYWRSVAQGLRVFVIAGFVATITLAALLAA